MVKSERRVVELEEIARLCTRSVEESFGKAFCIESIYVSVPKYPGLDLQALGAECRDNFARDVPIP